MPPKYIQATGNKPERARLALLSSLSSNSPLLGNKIRTAGRTIAVDSRRSRVIIEHDGYGVLVDLSLCLKESHLPRIKDTIMVVGDLEARMAGDEELPKTHLASPSPCIDPKVIISAIILTVARDDSDLDLRQFAEQVALAVE